MLLIDGWMDTVSFRIALAIFGAGCVVAFALIVTHGVV